MLQSEGEIGWTQSSFDKIMFSITDKASSSFLKLFLDATDGFGQDRLSGKIGEVLVNLPYLILVALKPITTWKYYLTGMVIGKFHQYMQKE